MTKFMKYPRSFHLPWSRGYTDDDKVARNVNHFIGKEVVVTEKLDGEGQHFTETICMLEVFIQPTILLDIG